MADDKKQKIYAAVLELFKEGKSIKSIKVSEIANRAGIGKGSIYLHFASKNDVIVEAAKFFFDTWLTPFKEYVIDEKKSFKDSMYEFINIHFNLLDEYSSFFDPQQGAGYLNVFNSTTLPEMMEVARNARIEYLGLLEKVLRTGEKQKVISNINRYSVNVAAESIMLMVKYLYFTDIRGEEQKYSEDQCGQMACEMIVRVCK